MKVIHLSSSDLSGGASIACKRISDALVSNGIDSSLLVQRKFSNDNRVFPITQNSFATLFYYIRFALDEGYIRLFTNQSRGRYTNPLIGTDISKHPQIIDSDIIHLHWINGGYLSLESLKQIKKLNKPIVWTLHDMWAFTGGCHYSLDCRKFESECFDCPSLKNSGSNDASRRIFNSKDFFGDMNLSIVTCSCWLMKEAQKSIILGNKKIVNIPNPVDINLFKPNEVDKSREKLALTENKIYLLFGAMNTSEVRKGFSYLQEGLKILAGKNDVNRDEIEILIFGKASKDTLNDIPFKKHFFGNLKTVDDLVACYNAADLFIAPSLQDNLPNTVLESLSCGTPVLAFNIGGMPDMIDHLENGYLAEPGSVKDLVNGIEWYFNLSNSKESLKIKARNKITGSFNQEIVSSKYLELYSSLI